MSTWWVSNWAGASRAVSTLSLMRRSRAQIDIHLRLQLVACAGLLGSCALHAKPAKPVIMANTQVNATVDGVRGAVLNLSQDASENTERTADTIAAQTQSPQVRINAIQWKLVSSVELESAALARDPVVALGELILFTLQSRNFLSTGEGRELFGRLQLGEGLLAELHGTSLTCSRDLRHPRVPEPGSGSGTQRHIPAIRDLQPGR